jgi:hypothetical protein
MNTAQLPELNTESQQKIERARKDARARLKQAFIERAPKAKLRPALVKRTVNDTRALLKQASLDDRNAATLHLLEAMAWEYICSRRFKGSQESEGPSLIVRRKGFQAGQTGTVGIVARHLARRSSFLQGPHRGCASIFRGWFTRRLKDGVIPVVEPVIREGILTERDCTRSATGRKPGDPTRMWTSLM